MPDLTFIPRLEIAAIAANTIFLFSYIIFVVHIYDKKTVEGISVWFLLLTLLAFCILATSFLVQWQGDNSLWNAIFVGYYAAGAWLSVFALAGWRRYK